MVNKPMTLFMLSLLAGILMFPSLHAFSQKESKAGIYDPSLDGQEEINKYVKQAKKEGKHVLLQVGGNW